MSHVVTWTAQETAERLIPILRDYAEKLSAFNERATATLTYRMPLVGHALMATVLEAVRLVSLKATLDKPIAAITQTASGLLEHAELEHVVWLELKLRLDEVEEHLRFATVAVGELRMLLTSFPHETTHIRKQFEQARWKPPV